MINLQDGDPLEVVRMACTPGAEAAHWPTPDPHYETTSIAMQTTNDYDPYPIIQHPPSLPLESSISAVILYHIIKARHVIPPPCPSQPL